MFLMMVLMTGSLWAGGARVLLISPPELEDAWKDYAEIRGKQRAILGMITTEEIDNKYEGVDLADKIRKCAREHIEKHRYHTIILGGDSSPEGGLIPDRDTFHQNQWGKDVDIPTDIYFISPTSWDHDGDEIYGEFKDDREAISYPDGSIAIGRIPVRTKEDIVAYGKKVSNHFFRKESKQLAMTCAVRGAYAKVRRSGSKLIPEAWPDGKVSFLFNDFSSWDGEEKGDYDLSNEHLLEKLNAGEVTKWHIHGHGLVDRWILENDESFSYDQVAQLKNFEHPAIITTVSCFTGQFDGKKDPCISEAMLRHPGGGAVAIVAPSREGKPHFHNPKKDFPLMVREGKLDGTTQTMTSFWKKGLGGKQTTGMALAKSKAALADDAKKSATYHQGICEINLLGDPTLIVK
ncbi:C25 family cysteine peptidase [Akkermansiaceae bacterium]|nr:C25 family cysteine peptidase [Akkermansiaceae bacterium]